MSKRKAIGIGTGMMVVGIIVGICIMMFIVKTNPRQEYEDRKRYGTLLEYEEALSQAEEESETLGQENEVLEQENESLKQENDTLKNEKQSYAENAYNLGKAEFLAVSIMRPEDAAEFQNKIQQIIDSDMTLEEQKKKIDEIFQILEEYIAGGTSDSSGL